MTIHQPKQRGRWHTCKDVDTHLFCTWLNVTVRHVLICWRYRLNDGRVVTFTQARELTQALRGAKGDEDGWYVYGETLSCAFAMEMWRNRLAFPQHLSWLCATPSLSSSLILRALLLACVCFFSFRRAFKCKTGSRVCVCAPLQLLAQLLLLYHPRANFCSPRFMCFLEIPSDRNQLLSWLTRKQLHQTLHYSPLAPTSPLLFALLIFFSCSLAGTHTHTHTLSHSPLKPRLLTSNFKWA